MALKAYATQAEVPEALRGEYVEKDGKWIPDVEGAEDIYASGLKRQQTALMDDLKSAQRKLKEYDGIDPKKHKELVDAAKAAQDAIDTAEAEKLKATGDWTAREKQMKDAAARELQQTRDAAKAELEAATAKTNKQTTFIERQIVENKVREVFAPLLVSGAAVNIMLDHIRKHIRVVEAGDEGWRPEVVEQHADGQWRARVKGSQGEVFTIADLAKEMGENPEYADFFKGTVTQGSGSRGSGPKSSGKLQIRATDTAAFNKHLDKIASGEAEVIPG